MKKILVNGLLLSGKFSGVRYSIECLLNAMADIDCPEIGVGAMVGEHYAGPLTSRNGLDVLPANTNTKSRLRRIMFENFRLPAYYRKECYDAYHSPGYVLPMRHMSKSLVTVHDIIALQFPSLCEQKNALYFNAVLPHSIDHADRIIAVSHTVKADIVKRFSHVNPDKIVVIHQGVGGHFQKITNVNRLEAIRAKYNLPQQFLLFVGNVEPKKNLLRLATVLSELKKHLGVSQKLVIAGNAGWGFAAFQDQMQKLSLSDEVVITGHVAAEDLPGMYSLADVFVFPSLYEGFGIPPLEAMACGTPVVSSDRGALPEVTGGHCHMVDPESIAAMVKTLHCVITDTAERTRHCAAADAWQRRFTWHATATRTLQEYVDMTRDGVHA